MVRRKCRIRKTENSSGLGEIPYWRYSPRPDAARSGGASADPVKLRDQQYSLDGRRTCAVFLHSVAVDEDEIDPEII